MNKLKLINLIELIIIILITILSIILLIILNPTTSTSYKVFVSLLFCINSIIHLIFMAIKLAKNIDFKHRTYEEAYFSFVVMFGALMTYILNYVDNFNEYYYIFYILLIIPILAMPLFYVLAKNKDKKINEKARKLPIKTNNKKVH